MANVEFKGTVEAKDGLTMSCTSREFTINMDEPREMGGNNTGMNPVEALLNAIGACKAIVARCYGEAKGVKFTNLKIELTGTLDPAGFMGQDPNAKIGLSKVHTKYYFESEESEEKLAEFVEFMEHTCPVMDTIINNPEFTGEVIKL